MTSGTPVIVMRAVDDVWKGRCDERILGYLGCDSLERSRWHLDCRDPLRCRGDRPADAWRVPLRNRFYFLILIALLQGGNWPRREDWRVVAGLGLLFFGLFPILFNASLLHTTAARGALALATVPLQTLIVGALFGVEPLTGRKLTGVLVAMAGVAIALLSRLSGVLAPEAAWIGDLLMIGAALCMAFCNVWSKPLVRRSGPLQFTAMMMASGALFLVIVAWLNGGFHTASQFSVEQWLAVLYLGVIGSAVTFYLWAFALQRTTPTNVAVSVTVNPVVASLMRVMLLERALALEPGRRLARRMRGYRDRRHQGSRRDQRKTRSSGNQVALTQALVCD